MLMHKINFLFFVLCLISGCGNNTERRNNPTHDPLKQEPPQFNISDTWRLKSKHCGETLIPIKPMESYKFDSSHLVQIEKLSEDLNSLCKVGLVYDRIIVRSQSNNGIYSESATLSASSSKKSCWQKADGVLVEPPTSEIITFSTDPVGLKITAEANSISLELEQSAECWDDVLHVLLEK